MADVPGVHNLLEVSNGIYSGSVPEGDAGFGSLKKLGIRTIISVDGGTPDIARARALGFRYVHLPVGYEGIPADKQRQIARAMRHLPGPVYLHCHHGKHRGPAATASAAVLLGLLSPDQGVSFLKMAGTADVYTGLYACVAGASAAESSELDSAGGEFPEAAPAGGLVSAMVAIDEANEHLMLIQKAGWKVPGDHPDLVPAEEARQLAALMATLKAEEPSDDDEFQRLSDDAARHSSTLETLLRSANPPRDQLDAAMKAIKASCADCHRRFRDHRKF
jgi:hypothetical protein